MKQVLANTLPARLSDTNTLSGTNYSPSASKSADFKSRDDTKGKRKRMNETSNEQEHDAIFDSKTNAINYASTASATIGMIIGGAAIIFAAISFITNMQLVDIIAWMDKYFGITFTLLFASLVIVSVYAILKVTQRQSIPFWSQVGAQAANGISTLALTFTLLGISLGIGSLSQQSLTPDNVNSIISVLTAQFSMAFMTTVVGLPTSTAIRAWLSILLAKQSSVDKSSPGEGD